MAFVFMGIGAFAISAATFDWDWFMNSRKAGFFVRMFGRNGTRVFYGLLGTALVVLGVLVAMGIIQESK